ncbi:6-phosphogluconolactonase [Mucilaginibacter pineti]|uniref:6-phosphogluconolactonase n=1 Tax=Mucilaginibacter pineti TaxID=1391627 RepID=A0A1G7FYT8_9SPHI|nr:lactonase family protein [Mucilaginibacter pineti]SDE81041.1 6-phosphogluconolactonase [Mucilaginibacter pineti]
MKKVLLMIALLSPLLSSAQNKSNKKTGPKTYDLVVGTYTTGKSKGIVVYRFYVESGKLAYLSEIDDVTNPSYLTVSKNNHFIYAVNELPKGEVSAFSFDAKTGKMAFINKQSSAGADPCYIAVDKDQKNALVANYSSGTVAVLPINKDGSLGAAIQTIKGEGSGPNKDRQASAHAHMSAFSPDEKYVFYNDLGTDKVNIFRYHAGKEVPLVPADPASVSVEAGAGPRHIDFSADKKHAYLLTEMGSSVVMYDYNNGKLTQKQVITMLPDGFKGQTGAAAIHVSPDGRFLYASNRLETNEIVVYGINQENGMLTFVQRQSSYGKNPRDFAIDPTGKFMIVANQNSDNMYVFRIDQSSGRISQTGIKIDIGNPVCLKFVPSE